MYHCCLMLSHCNRSFLPSMSCAGVDPLLYREVSFGPAKNHRLNRSGFVPCRVADLELFFHAVIFKRLLVQVRLSLKKKLISLL